MDKGADPVLEAIAALRFHGHTVERLDTYPPTWRFDGNALTNWEMVAFAMDLGLMDRPDRTQ